jgi:hypothetical protein
MLGGGDEEEAERGHLCAAGWIYGCLAATGRGGRTGREGGIEEESEGGGEEE